MQPCRYLPAILLLSAVLFSACSPKKSIRTVEEVRVFTDQPAMSFELNTKSFMSVYARTGKLLALHPHKDKKAPDQEIIEVELDPQ